MIMALSSVLLNDDFAAKRLLYEAMIIFSQIFIQSGVQVAYEKQFIYFSLNRLIDLL